MNYTQNAKLEQVNEKTIIVGVDIGSETHFARAFDWRKVELSKKVFRFGNDIEGFTCFIQWIEKLQKENDKENVMVGCEPTGHYWYALDNWLKSHGIQMVFVNPYHVKKVKELDDNSPKKTDQKDPKTIAGLIVDGRYLIPYVPTGIYADIRELISSRDRIQKDLNAVSNRIQRWLKIYFPEYHRVYKLISAVSGLIVLKQAPLPEDIIALGVDGIVQIWRANKVRRAGQKRAENLVEAAHNSIGVPGGLGARLELLYLLEDYERKQEQLEYVTKQITEMVMKVPHVEKMLAIKGIGLITVAGFIAEVGDIRRFESPKQIQKYAGLELVEKSSGKHKGRSTISKRGRRKLRKILYLVALPLIHKNEEFHSIYEYYTTRKNNPLKGMQARIAIACKLIRIFHAILTKGITYDPQKMLKDIHRPEALPAA